MQNCEDKGNFFRATFKIFIWHKKNARNYFRAFEFIVAIN